MRQESEYTGVGLINVSQDLVIKILNQCMQEFSFCSCQICLNDIAAYTLSNVSPIYITNRLDYNRTIERIDTKEMTKMVIKGIKLISQNPHH